MWSFYVGLKVEGIFETQQSIGLEWRDPRLQVNILKIVISYLHIIQKPETFVKFNSQFYNLRPLTDSNTLLEAEKNQIWIPSLTFVNTATQVL